MPVPDRQALIEQYREGADVIEAALDGISEAELDTPEAPGEWTPRQIVHHLADSELNSAVRLRKLLAEDEPRIVAYDQDHYARVLHYDRPIEASLLLFWAIRSSCAELLDRLDEADWHRHGTHSESGLYSVMDWLTIYAAHAHQHAEQIRRARAAKAAAEA